MSVSAAHAKAFFSEAVSGRAVWSIADDRGHPAPVNQNGERSMPFWSTESRAARVTDRVAAYSGFDIVRIDLETWKSRWLPGLTEDGLLVGLNWSGDRVTGFDIEPGNVREQLAHAETGADAVGHPDTLIPDEDG